MFFEELLVFFFEFVALVFVSFSVVFSFLAYFVGNVLELLLFFFDAFFVVLDEFFVLSAFIFAFTLSLSSALVFGRFEFLLAFFFFLLYLFFELERNLFDFLFFIFAR